MKKLNYTLMIFFSIAFVGFLGYGCSNDENTFENKNSYSMKDDAEFLDFSTSDVNMFSDKELEILNKAYQRIDQHLIVRDDTCYLTVHSAEEVNMSYRLFSLVKEGIATVNMQYKAYLSLKDNDLGITIKNPFKKNLSPRLKTGSESTYTSGPYWSTQTTKLSHADVTIVVNALRSSNGNVGTFGSIIAGVLSGSVVGALVGIYAYLMDSRFSQIQDDYASSGLTTGLSLIAYTTYSPNTGVSFTNYRASY